MTPKSEKLFHYNKGSNDPHTENPWITPKHRQEV